VGIIWGTFFIHIIIYKMVFCFLGVIGSCGSHAQSKNLIEKQTTLIQNYMSNKTSKILSVTRHNVQNIQALNVVSQGDVVMEDVGMSQYAYIDASTTMNITNILKDEETINDIIDIMVDTSMEQTASSGGSWTSTAPSLTKKKKKIVNTVKKEFRISAHSMTNLECVSRILNNQQISVKTAGNVTIKGVKIEQTASLVSECMLNTIQNLLKDIEISSNVTDKAVTERKNISKSTNYSSYVLIGGIILIALIIFLPLILLIAPILISVIMSPIKLLFKRKKIIEKPVVKIIEKPVVKTIEPVVKTT